jgi:3-isopropylmalate/(R)-2-methylmalate dehydratase small subunit
LLDFGIRSIIAPSFADIFFNNCFKNGILPVVLPEADVARALAAAEGGETVTVDLPSQQIRLTAGDCLTFAVDPFQKHCLLNGLDDIGLTLQKVAKVDAFEARQRAERPWLAA